MFISFSTKNENVIFFIFWLGLSHKLQVFPINFHPTKINPNSKNPKICRPLAWRKRPRVRKWRWIFVSRKVGVFFNAQILLGWFMGVDDAKVWEMFWSAIFLHVWRVRIIWFWFGDVRMMHLFKKTAMGELKFFGAPEFTQLNSYSHVKNMSVGSIFLQPLVGRVLIYHISTLHEALSFLKDMTWFHGPSCTTWNDRMCSVNYVVGNSESCSPSPAGVSQSSPGWHDTFISAIFSNLKRHGNPQES